MGFLSLNQLKAIGFKCIGKNVLVSDKASIYNASKIELGSYIRIDDFCVLSAGEGGISLGNHVHIACFSSLIGKGNIRLDDFSNISSRVSIYSSSDDYSGKKMTNPTIPDGFKNVDDRPVSIGRHAIIGSGSVILPGVKIGEGCAVGALSLIKKDCDPFGIYAGIHARRIAERQRGLLNEEKRFLEIQSRD
jgi:acetyltransferase-like isoleucine patch superfamily enzyme